MRKRYNTPHRSRVVKTRMTEEEYAEFAERLSAYNMSQAEFIRQAITGAAIRPIITVSPVNDELLAAVGKLTAEYGRIGGNLNQIAHQQKKVNDFAISLLGDSVLIPFGSVHFESPDAISELDRLHDAGIKGIKLHPDYQGFFADDERMFPIYEKIGSLGMITVFHAGVDIGVPDPVHCTPQMLKKILPRFGGAPVIAAHMGGFLLWREAAELLGGTGIYIDTAFSSGSVPPPWAKESVEAFGTEHVLFGSDNPWSPTGRELAFVRSIGLKEEETELILGQNAARLLGL